MTESIRAGCTLVIDDDRVGGRTNLDAKAVIENQIINTARTCC